MLIRTETAADVDVIRQVTMAAFALPDRPGDDHARLVDGLRADPAWIPALSWVAVLEDAVVGHVVTTRGWVGDQPALGLGPLSVLPGHQRQGVGKALVHTSLGASDALGEPLVVLLGSPAYYERYGFGPASDVGITGSDPAWGADLQVRTLSAYDPAIRGEFRFADPFGAF